MQPGVFTYLAKDGLKITAYKWVPKNPKGVVQIAHGAIEHAMRYEDFANALAAQGFAVYAEDHRGHGQTAGGIENIPYLSDQNGGFMMMVADVYQLTGIIRAAHPGLPVFLLGHSMGAAIGRVYAVHHGEALGGLVLTGTGRVNPFLNWVVRTFARAQMKLMGRKHKSPLLHAAMFGTLNRPFGGETGSEFISTDEAVVAAYAADPMCGNRTTAEFCNELMWGIRQAAKKKTIAATPKGMPIFIGAGEHDSMGGGHLAAVKADVADYRKNGAADLTFRVYEGMRHEVLNEKDKRRVYADIIEWLDAHTENV